MGFFKWFNPKEFMNTYQEWHAFVEGLCEVVCPWKARYEPSEELLNDLKREHHYYQAGRAVGVFVWVGIIALIKVIVE